MRLKRTSFDPTKLDILALEPGDQVERLRCVHLVAERIRAANDKRAHAAACDAVRTRIRDQLKAKKLTGLNPVTDTFAWFHFAIWALNQPKWSAQLDDFRAAIERRTSNAQANILLGEVILSATANGVASDSIELRRRLKESELRRSELENENSNLRTEVASLRSALANAEPAIRAAAKRAEDGQIYGARGGRPRKGRGNLRKGS